MFQNEIAGKGIAQLTSSVVPAIRSTKEGTGSWSMFPLSRPLTHSSFLSATNLELGAVYFFFCGGGEGGGF